MKLSFKLKKRLGITELQQNTRKLIDILAEDYIDRNLYQNPKYQNPKKLNRFEYQVFSQNGEDGIINEIFKRIGTTNRFFVEFGAEDGFENNTLNLLVKGWSGSWMEGGEGHVKNINTKFKDLIEKNRLKVFQAFITKENIEDLLKKGQVPKELDLLSIDIDGNDYWVWQAIQKYQPRLVVIEYNSLFRPDTKWVMKYNPEHIWNQTCYAGASLKSLELLGSQKGYKLVACDFLGVNAFFVRKDLVKDKFLAPYTAENHYEPPRFHLSREVSHKRDFGPFESI